MLNSKPIDWKALAKELDSAKGDGDRIEMGSRALALAALEKVIGAEQWEAAVDHYVAMQTGFELARSVLWLVHPWAAMLRCRELFASSGDIHVRRSAVELLRVVADARVLPWVEDFLNDPDAEIQMWGIGIVDQLLFSELASPSECEASLARGRAHANPAVREAVAEMERQVEPSKE